MNKYKESILDMVKNLGIEDFAKENLSSIEEESQKTQPVIGEFKPKDKFIEFVGAKGNVNFLSNEAFIDGKYLSGLGLDDVKFKLTICDEGTVNFEEVDTNQTTKEQRQRLLEVISEKTIVPSRNKMMIINELPFMSVKTINDKQIPLYLAVDYQKPIDKLASLLDEDVIMSDEQSSKLDNLLSMFDDEEEPKLAQVLFESETEDEIAREFEGENDIEVIVTETEPVFDYNKQMEESFAKMKQEKIDELNKRLDNKKKELFKFTQDMNLSTKKVNDTKDEIKLLESRLESLTPDVESTGYLFNVSEMQNEKVVLEPEIAEIIKNKISKVKSINTEAFMKLFEQGEFIIRLGVSNNDEVNEVKDYQNLPDNIKDILANLQITIVDDTLKYIGELTWGDIVNKFVKAGFAQDSNFDKHCGSNSYQISEKID
jgi:ribosomal protein L29